MYYQIKFISNKNLNRFRGRIKEFKYFSAFNESIDISETSRILALWFYVNEVFQSIEKYLNEISMKNT